VPRSAAANDALRRESIGKILKAAVAVFARHGLEGTAIDDVAGEAGVSKGLVYRYFRSKEELFVKALAASLSEIYADVPNSAGGLKEYAANAIALTLRHVDLQRLHLATMLQPGTDLLIPGLDSALSPNTRLREKALGDAFALVPHHRPHLDPMLFQLALNGIALAVLVRPELRRSTETVDALCERLVQLFTGGPDAPG
jgi:AcrR family transcriptional regulator